MSFFLYLALHFHALLFSHFLLFIFFSFVVVLIAALWLFAVWPIWHPLCIPRVAASFGRRSGRSPTAALPQLVRHVYQPPLSGHRSSGRRPLGGCPCLGFLGASVHSGRCCFFVVRPVVIVLCSTHLAVSFQSSFLLSSRLFDCLLSILGVCHCRSFRHSNRRYNRSAILSSLFVFVVDIVNRCNCFSIAFRLCPV